MKQQAVIKGLGFHVPERILTNQDLERLVETSDEWITTRTGIKTRHVISPGESLSDLTHGASLKALADAELSPEAITHILVATFSPESVIPSAACVLQDRLGLRGRMAQDISAACTGFLYALETARGLLALHPEAKILVCSGDVVTSRVNWEDRGTCVLFGDGCGAAVLTADDGGPRRAVLRDVALASDGALGDLLSVRGGGSGTIYKPRGLQTCSAVHDRSEPESAGTAWAHHRRRGRAAAPPGQPAHHRGRGQKTRYSQ
jgi:3-oxoacyl-[acyl-carrier-protein] synthase-3